MNLTSKQKLKFYDQILIVLADYQSTVPASCLNCFVPFITHADAQAWTELVVRSRLDDTVKPPDPNLPCCPKCGADAYGFARGENVRAEVAQRIMENLILCAKLSL